MNEYIEEGFLDELEKIAITRPSIEWFPEDRTHDSSPMLHSTAESHMYTGDSYMPKKMKGGYKTKKKVYDENDVSSNEELAGNTPWAQEISDPATARMISSLPTALYKNK